MNISVFDTIFAVIGNFGIEYRKNSMSQPEEIK